MEFINAINCVNRKYLKQNFDEIPSERRIGENIFAKSLVGIFLFLIYFFHLFADIAGFLCHQLVLQSQRTANFLELIPLKLHKIISRSQLISMNEKLIKLLEFR